MKKLLPWVIGVVVGAGLVAGCGGTPTAAPGEAPALTPGASPAPVAPPERVRIPAIGVDSTLIRTGMTPQGAPETPDVHQPGQASWADWSPEPGSVGPAVLYGHVDGEVGGRKGVPGVFARVRDLQVGQPIYVDRGDGSTAVFAVTVVKPYPKAALDTRRSGDQAAREVYGDRPGAELRLVTCGGTFDRAVRSYRDQVVVFAVLDHEERL